MMRTRSVVKKESGGSVTVVLASTAESQAHEHPPGSTVDWAALEHEVVPQLAGLRDVEGVIGSFLVDPAGAALGVDLPQVFDRDLVGEAVDRVARIRDSFEARGDRLCSLELRFAQQRLYLRCVDGGFLGLLIVGQANMPLLAMATSVVLRKLASPARSSRSTLPSRANPPATSRNEQSLSGSRSATRGTQVPGAPAAGGARPKRPVYFRGRRVGSE